RERLIEWLDKYIIMDDVTLADETPLRGTLALEGPQAAAMVSQFCAIDISSLAELSSIDAAIASVPCRIIKRSPGRVPRAEFVVAREHLLGLWPILAEAARQYGGRPVGYSAMSARRLALGVPWFSYDFGEKQIPHEAGLQDSHISYTKGCYTGQEIVERVRSRGQVNRQRVELVFSGETVPAAGTLLMLDDKEVGHVTRAARIWDPTRVIAMAYVRKEAQAPGTTLGWTNGTATVVRFEQTL